MGRARAAGRARRHPVVRRVEHGRRFRTYRRLLRTAPLADRFLLLITFVLTVFVDLVVAVNVGVVLASLLFMRRMAETVRVGTAVVR